MKGQYVRGTRMTSEDEDFMKECELLKSMFLERGYPERLINETLKEVLENRNNNFAPILGKENTNEGGNLPVSAM